MDILEKVKLECKELSEKTNKLERLLFSRPSMPKSYTYRNERPEHISENQWQLLHQHECMVKYRDVLKNRINDFENERIGIKDLI